MTAMDSTSFEGFVLDPAKCSKLSMEEKRELVYEISKWSNGAPELLQSWSRQDILQILCAEMGKERKYTGLTKLKIIENLLKVVSEKTSLETDLEPQPSGASGQRTAKRQRKTDNPSRIPAAANSASINIVDNDLGNNLYCKNSACKAKLGREDRFCKRCSCCICYQYDDNKDPSLWLTCSSEPPFEGNSCGMSCHLECALKHERSGIPKDGLDRGLDGSFYCVSCRKVNDLLGCWRKQMITARDTRRVDILCYRVSLGQKLISGTKCYQKLYGIVDEAMKKLEEDVGPLTGLPVKMARGIVNRLSSGQDVQRLCASAVESLDLMLSDTGFNISSGPCVPGSNMVAPIIKFENVGTSSLTVNLGTEDQSRENGVGYTLWHRMTDETDYSAEPTCTLFAPNTRFSLSGLTPATEYLFKVVSFNRIGELGMHEVRFQTCSDNDKVSHPKNGLKLERSHSPVTNCSSLSNPSSVEDENNNDNENQKGKCIAYCKKTEDIISGDLSNEAVGGTGAGPCGTRGDSLSMLDEEPNMGSVPNGAVDLENNENSPDQTVEETSTENDSNTPVQSGLECVPFAGSSDTALPITPCKLENFKEGPGRKIRPKNSNKAVDKDGSGRREEEPQDGGSSKKRCGERPSEECAENGDRDFGYYVKVIRWLECDGHIETSFRQKFLTWYSLRATLQEVRIVKVFVDTLIDDPASLAGQLIDTFSEVISTKRSSSAVPMGFCLRLWH